MTKPCLSCGVPTGAGSRCQPCQDVQGRSPDLRRGRKRARRPAAWDRLSRRVRRAQPWCEWCGTSVDLTTDHVQRLADGGPMLPGPDGVRVLCRPCNSRASVLGQDRGSDPHPPGGSGPGGLAPEAITPLGSAVGELPEVLDVRHVGPRAVVVDKRDVTVRGRCGGEVDAHNATDLPRLVEVTGLHAVVVAHPRSLP